ncbi:DUF1998 domain-containing protein [Aromatoleum bremense]|uniref:MrfA-like Zn-binding domain-containing protein n=1 Tax=Aromatoleum bremense TaxID=76115 RepID=A0ABX1P0R3_9RHOO|nr:DUF1998 domain-containing protein [Aromatoleum bremense]NMG17497.1 hypothetical protein [Aromatoleum bremense]QTQ33215.1 Uncharacterized protein pbN1_32270 [Aromatoleum bremense]
MSKEFIQVRLSHVLGQSGVGAIVRGANGLVVVQDTREWTDRHGEPAGKLIPYVERVRAALDLQALREPPVAKELANGQIDGTCVPATRFPSWMRCPSCGVLYLRPWKEAPADNALHCHWEKCKSKPRLEQVTWVLAHPAGYLADVRWKFLAHRHASTPAQKNCQLRDKLKLIDRGYDQRVLRCDREMGGCGAETLFRGDERLPFGQQRMQPWTREDIAPPDVAPPGDSDEGRQNLAQVLAINDTRAYAPKVVSVLIIPPESRVRKGTVVDLLYRNSAERKKLDSARTPSDKKRAIKKLATEYRCQPQDIEAALSDLDRGYPLYGENLTPGQLRESEFEAFLEVLPDQRDDEDLVTRNKSNEWHALEAANDLSAESKAIVRCVQHLVRVDRLKAVKVFRGFSRLGGEVTVLPDIVGQPDWLPAIELYGEGIFIALDEGRLGCWEQQPAVLARLENLQRRFAQSGRDEPNPLTPRFMLLHTLSHLLMRQIESEGGYPAASLIERIYCTHAPERMAGILIHVAVPDIAGSLGGLAELAEPKRFLGILSRALEHAGWCSLDPVCSEHDGQGPGLLNRAACHACTLVPEPACEYGNTLLDRCFIKGDDSHGLPAFFGAP